DNLVYRAGFAKTRRQSRQLVNHAHVYVDGRRTDIPSYRVVPGQVITLSEKAQKFDFVKDALEAVIARPEFVSFDENKFEVTYIRLPERQEILSDIKDNLIVEYYNR
ncbi:MAG: 30S ribosomal protein S4, partial [Candidatus Izimaplasma sp.]|nr:30S ribosomal protein S4 [Candidatus Izimaplasma bacterium]